MKIITLSISALLLIFLITHGMEKQGYQLPSLEQFGAALQNSNNYRPILPQPDNPLPSLLAAVEQELKDDASTTLMEIASSSAATNTITSQRIPVPIRATRTKWEYQNHGIPTNGQIILRGIQPEQMRTNSITISIQNNITVNTHIIQSNSTPPSISQLYKEKDGKFLCKVSPCKKPYTSLNALLNHIKTAHPIQAIVYCEKQSCSHAFPTQDALNTHIAQEHQRPNDTIIASHPLSNVNKSRIMRQELTEKYKKQKFDHN